VQVALDRPPLAPLLARHRQAMLNVVAFVRLTH
jgi:hypothetical protein